MDKTERKSVPTAMYRYAEGGDPEMRIFDHPSDIPEKEGWVDSPAKVKAPEPKKTDGKPADPAKPGDEKPKA